MLLTECAVSLFKGRMIYIENTTAPQQVQVPFGREAGGQGLLSLVLRSTVDLTETASLQFGDDFNGDYAIGSAAPEGTAGSLYVTFSVSLPEGVQPGSHEYRVEQDGQALVSGVAQVGVYPSVERVQYQKDVIYEQYETGD